MFSVMSVIPMTNKKLSYRREIALRRLAIAAFCTHLYHKIAQK